MKRKGKTVPTLNWAQRHEVWIIRHVSKSRGAVSFTLLPLCPWYALGRRSDGPHDQSRRGGEDRNPCPCQESNSSRSVTILTAGIGL
jgi:hypothetical protein